MSVGLPRKVEELEVNEAEDGLVIYDPAHDVVHHLNPTASLIFDLCDGTRDATTIADVLGETFGLDPPPGEEARAALNDLADRALILWPARGGPAEDPGRGSDTAHDDLG